MPTNSTDVRNLVPKSYSFDGYNVLNSPNSRDKPFWSNETLSLGEYHLTKRLGSNDTLTLEFESVCPYGKITFVPYVLTFENYVELLKESINSQSDFITLTIPFLAKCYMDSCSSKNRSCSFLLKNEQTHNIAAVSFNVKDIKNALSVYYGIKSSHKRQGGTSMKNNTVKLLGMNLEFGLSRDPQIAATLMGVAVRNKVGNWQVYDPATQSLKNYGNLKFGNFKVYLIPDSTLRVGQLYKIDGEYQFVKEVSGTYATLLRVSDGVVVNKLLSEGMIQGLTFYTRVVALDPKTLLDSEGKGGMGNNIIAALCMMNWSKGEKEFSLDDINDDSFNGLGTLLMLSGTNGLSNIFGGTGNEKNMLPMIMMLGAGNESEDANDLMQYMILSQMLGSGNGTTNPVDAGSSVINNLFGGTAIPEKANDANTVYCPDCGIDYPAGTNYCIKCGKPTQPKGKVCPECGKQLPDGAAFCPNCGKKLTIDVCPQCGAKVEEGSNFCATCGANLKAPKKMAAPKSKSRKKAVNPAPTPAPTTEETADSVSEETNKE